MTDKKLSIDDLFSDAGAFDEHEVSKALLPHISIQKSSNLIFFRNHKLPIAKKIIAYGLAKKLLRQKNIIETEMITAQEFFGVTKLKKNSIDPTFKMLKDSGLLVGKREYEIPVSKISEIIEILNNSNRHEKK
jgi:hypothetical protein